LLESAARIALRELDDPARAMRIASEADGSVPPGRLDGVLTEAAARLAKSAPEVARKSLKLVTEARQVRIDGLWDGEVKAELLLSLARLHRWAREDVNAALQCFELVLTSDLRTSLSSELLAAGLVDFAEALGRRGRHPEAEAALSEARLLVPNLPRSKPQPSPTAEPAATPTEITATPDDAALESPKPVPEARVAPSEDELRARAHGGDADALQALVQLLEADDARGDEAHALLGQLVRVAPDRTGALRQLYARALQVGAQAEARVCAQILSLFDPELSAAPRVPFAAPDLSSEELSEIVHTGQNRDLGRLLQLTWQYAQAIPRFRRTAEALQPGELIATHDGSALARAYNRATSLLGCPEVLVYTRPGAVPEVSALPTYPAAIVARSGLEDVVALEFQVARCLVYCEPHNALLCTLPEAEGRELVAAVLGAFGFAGSKHPLTRGTKELSAELWHAIPTRTQAQMRELLEPRIKDFEYGALRLLAERSAQRAGLFVASDVQTALKTLARTEEALRDHNVHTEPGFQRACQRSEAFREVIRSALSLPYVGLTALTLDTNA
jgi:tetratricopeptide (TPR) repeat protein